MTAITNCSVPNSIGFVMYVSDAHTWHVVATLGDTL